MRDLRKLREQLERQALDDQNRRDAENRIREELRDSRAKTILGANDVRENRRAEDRVREALHDQRATTVRAGHTERRAELSPDDQCPGCGYELTPRHAAVGVILPARADYMCMKCRRAYRLTGDGSQLTLVVMPERRVER